MKIVRTKFMRLVGRKYMLLFCWLLTAPKAVVSDADLNHEKIHAAQMKELLYIPFYLFYLIEWLARIIQFRNGYMAYRNISFEQEAYKNQEDTHYLETRERFAFVKYIKP